jgi:hypothetical protein
VLRSEIYNLVQDIWNKQELAQMWKESITVAKILSSLFVSRLTSYVEEIIWNHQCGFRCNRSTTDQIFCIRHILEKNRTIMGECISYL